MGCRMNRGVCLIILLPIPRPCEVPINEPANRAPGSSARQSVKRNKELAPSPLSKPAPSLISRLLPNQTHKIEILVKLVRLRPRITQKPLLVQLLGELSASPGQREFGHGVAQSNGILSHLGLFSVLIPTASNLTFAAPP